jgi:hypothetical protein
MDNALLRKTLLPLLVLVSFALYHANTGRGPDNAIYMRVAHQIVTAGDLNTLPHELATDTQWQITPSHHAPIHQNVGGVLFFLPATAMAFVSLKVASWLPDLPQRLYDINYHEMLWVGSTTYAMALLFCLVMFRVGRCYASTPAVIAALLACCYGGPLLPYTAVFPCQMMMPAALMAALLLHGYHFSDHQQKRTWLLLGAVWGLGVFVRSEFVVWGVFLLYGAMATPVARGLRWRQVWLRLAMAGCGGLLFVVPSVMIRQVLFATPGSTYGIQFDLEILKQAYLMLVGGRNGLFFFWPVLLIALLGYGIRVHRNPALFHVMAGIMVLVAVICGSTNFWSGELGASFGQRRFLAVLPCFILFLARLFDLGRRYFWGLALLCAAGALWSLALCCVYGEVWRFADGRVGFLMPYHYGFVVSALTTCAAELPAKLFALVLWPKHGDMVWLAPLAAMGGTAIYITGRRLRRWLTLTEGCLGLLVTVACATTLFLSGARARGEATFAAISQANPEARFVVRNYEIDDEIVGSLVDVVSFFMEIGQGEIARYFVDKGARFLEVEAPDQLEGFREMVDGLALRQAMGWYRLVPEQSHVGLRQWYQQALINRDAGVEPPDFSGQIVY